MPSQRRSKSQNLGAGSPTVTTNTQSAKELCSPLPLPGLGTGWRVHVLLPQSYLWPLTLKFDRATWSFLKLKFVCCGFLNYVQKEQPVTRLIGRDTPQTITGGLEP